MSDNDKQTWMANRGFLYIVFMTDGWHRVETTGWCRRTKGGPSIKEDREEMEYEIKEPRFWNKNRTRWVDQYNIIFCYPETKEIFKCKCGET
jgi:hypothetical protein